MDFLGKTCPVCSQNFHEGDDVVVCPKCGAPYHRDCFKQKGKCIFPELHKDGKSWKDVYDFAEIVPVSDVSEVIREALHISLPKHRTSPFTLKNSKKLLPAANTQAL